MTSRAIVVLSILAIAAPAGAQFTYRPAGELVDGSGSGRSDSTVYVPDMRFPIESGHAYANSQVYSPGGGGYGSGSQCDSSNYAYPWHDNYCESRSWDMPMCPSGTGHQGQDIRPETCEDGVHWVVATTSGRISHIGSYSVYLTDEMGRRFDYLHMSDIQVREGDEVQCGDRLGKVSNVFDGTPTTIHLHFNVKMNVAGYGMVYTPPYMSLVSSYQRLSGYRCQEPLPVCPEEDLAAGATCETFDGRDACIGSIAVTDEGCPEGDDHTRYGRTCNCVADGAGGARWECPDTATCRQIDVCDACGDVVDGGSGSGGSGSGGSGSGGSGSGGSGSGGSGSGGSGGSGVGGSGSGYTGSGGVPLTCAGAPYAGGAAGLWLAIAALAFVVWRR